jgi:AhpC/TSA family
VSGPLSFDDEAEPDKPPNAQRPTPKPDIPPPAKPPGMSRYGWWFGVLVFVILAYIGFNTIRNADSGGSRGIAAGKHLPPFAMPLALAPTTKHDDANIATKANQGASGTVPACDVRGPNILNSCQLVAGAPAVLAFLTTSGGDCTKQLDLMQRVRARYPGIRFAAVAIKGDRGKVRSTIRSHGWRFPVGYDKDGAVANLYDVAVCPTVVFAHPGGKALRSTVGLLDSAKLTATLDELQGSSG